MQKSSYAEYLNQAVDFEAGDLAPLCKMAAAHNISIYLGTIEKAADRGEHSLYCSMVYIDQVGSFNGWPTGRRWLCEGLSLLEWNL